MIINKQKPRQMYPLKKVVIKRKSSPQITRNNLYSMIFECYCRRKSNMPKGNFSFLYYEWPAIYECAHKAESYLSFDPEIGCMYARKSLEAIVDWVIKKEAIDDRNLPTLKSKVMSPILTRLMGRRVQKKSIEIIFHGNRASHENGVFTPEQAEHSVSALYDVCYWFGCLYGYFVKPKQGQVFCKELIQPSLLMDLQAIEEIITKTC